MRLAFSKMRWGFGTLASHDCVSDGYCLYIVVIGFVIIIIIIIIIIKHLLSAIHPGKNLLGGAEQDIQYIKISDYAQKLRTLLNN